MKTWLTFFLVLMAGILQCQDNIYLQFENYRESSAFPSEELENYFGEKIRFFTGDTIGQNILYPGKCLPSSSLLYDYLIDKDVVSGYVDIYKKEKIPKDKNYVSKKEFINRLKKSVNIYYRGEVIQDNELKSLLFCTYKHDSISKIRKEFMVNIKNDYIKSIIVLTHYYFSDFGYKQFSIYKGEQKYLHGIKTLYSDVAGVDLKEEQSIGFRIDPEGFVVIE